MVGPLRIVGEALINSDDAAVGPGEGVLVTESLRRRLDPSVSPSILLRADPAVPPETVVRSLSEKFDDVGVPSPQYDIQALTQVRTAPWVIATLVSLIAVGALAHALTLAVRRRRRDFAVLRSLGFTRQQVTSAVAWRAVLVAGSALVIGVPLGLVGGRWAWELVADRVGLALPARVDPVFVGLTLGAVIAAVMALSIGPGLLAGRGRVADALRSE
jgi:putative ABC transport system permease protein